MFRDNLRKAISRKGLVVKEAAARAEISKRTVDNWLSQKPTVPAADDAVKIAIALDTTVEELIDGKSGKEYVIDWAGQHGAQWKPPPRMVPLIEAAEKLSDSELKKLVEIAKICKTDALESTPQTKTG